MMPPRQPLTVVRLADHLGQYIITIRRECGHTRTARPKTSAALAGWDALLTDVVQRLRCSQCGKRKCAATVRPETKRDGQSDGPLSDPNPPDSSGSYLER